MLDGAGLLAMPADQVEAAAAIGIVAVRHDGEVLEARPVAQQLALPGLDADRQIAAGRRVLLRPVAVARHVVDLGPLADRIGFLARWLPVILGQRLDAVLDLLAHAHRDRVPDDGARPSTSSHRARRARCRREALFHRTFQAVPRLPSRMTRRLPMPAGTLPSRNSSATITSCSAHSTSTG